MTGKLIPDLFPKVFGPRGDEPLDEEIVRERFVALARDIGDGREPEAVADGFHRHRGRQNGRGDQDDFGRARLRRDALCAQLLRRRGRPARLRRRRRARRSRPCSSIRCRRCSRPTAWGLPTSAPSARKGSTSRFTSSALLARRRRRGRACGGRGREVEGQGVAREAIKVHRRAQLRYAGSDTTIEVPSRRPRRCGALSRARTRAASASSTAPRRSPSKRSRPKLSAARRGSRSAPLSLGRGRAAPQPARATRFFSHGALARGRRLSARAACRSAPPSTGRR